MVREGGLVGVAARYVRGLVGEGACDEDRGRVGSHAAESTNRFAWFMGRRGAGLTTFGYVLAANACVLEN